jgi:glucose dehydrogenase
MLSSDPHARLRDHFARLRGRRHVLTWNAVGHCHSTIATDTGRDNPGPDCDGSVRPGDNLYTSSVVAFDPDDGQLRWHYQWTPHDVWDYDGVNENILFEQDGRNDHPN